MRFRLSTFSFNIPDEWRDITPEGDSTHPFTIALEDGVGVIQLSLAEWKSGKYPHITADQLRLMFLEYCKTQGLAIDPMPIRTDRIFGIGGKGTLGGDLLGAWYISDGGNVALVTYLGGAPGTEVTEWEFSMAQEMVKSASFLDGS